MPYSEIALYDLGLDDQCNERPETLADSQRVIYEDIRLEYQRIREAESVAEAQLAATATSRTIIAKSFDGDGSHQQILRSGRDRHSTCLRSRLYGCLRPHAQHASGTCTR